MKLNVIAGAIGAAFLSANAAHAATVTLDFEGFPISSEIATTYAGVTFNGAIFRQCGGGCPAPSLGAFAGPVPGSSMSVTFGQLQSQVSFINVSASNVTANAYDAAHNLIATLSDSSGGFTGPHVLSGFGISSIEFVRNGGDFGIDNLTFDYSVAAAVPEPATWAMMIVGFGAVGSMVRTSRRRTALSVA
jgi:hypothetical protein